MADKWAIMTAALAYCGAEQPLIISKHHTPQAKNTLQHGFLNCGTCTTTGTPKIVFPYAATLRSLLLLQTLSISNIVYFYNPKQFD
jgi:hypothetical protein